MIIKNNEVFHGEEKKCTLNTMNFKSMFDWFKPGGNEKIRILPYKDPGFTFEHFENYEKNKSKYWDTESCYYDEYSFFKKEDLAKLREAEDMIWSVDLTIPNEAPVTVKIVKERKNTGEKFNVNFNFDDMRFDEPIHFKTRYGWTNEMAEMPKPDTYIPLQYSGCGPKFERVKNEFKCESAEYTEAEKKEMLEGLESLFSCGRQTGKTELMDYVSREYIASVLGLDSMAAMDVESEIQMALEINFDEIAAPKDPLLDELVQARQNFHDDIIKFGEHDNKMFEFRQMYTLDDVSSIEDPIETMILPPSANAFKAYKILTGRI